MRFHIPIAIVVSLGVGGIIGYGLGKAPLSNSNAPAKTPPNRTNAPATEASGDSTTVDVGAAMAFMASDQGKVAPSKLDDATLDGAIAKLTVIQAALSVELATFRKSHEVFLIFGDIKDRDENNVMIYGTATNMRIDRRNIGQHLEETSILVQGYATENLLGQYYKGNHCFLERREGKNAFGAAVPIYVYGTEPPEIKEAIAILDKLQQLKTEKAKRSP